MRFREILGLLGGVAAIACVTAAAAAEKQHVMNVRLPDGSVEHVRYTGDTPPRILIADPAAQPAAMMPMAGFGDPFADMARISAMMDAQADAMMAHASEIQRVAMTQAAAPAGEGQMTVVNMPQGAGGYSYVSTTTVNGKTCTVSMTSQPGKQGAQPQMLRKVSGDGCTAAQQQGGPHLAVQPATPTPPAKPHTVSLPVAPKAPAAPAAPTAPADTI
jgi:hypothetical protein